MAVKTSTIDGRVHPRASVETGCRPSSSCGARATRFPGSSAETQALLWRTAGEHWLQHQERRVGRMVMSHRISPRLSHFDEAQGTEAGSRPASHKFQMSRARRLQMGVRSAGHRTSSPGHQPVQKIILSLGQIRADDDELLHGKIAVMRSLDISGQKKPVTEVSRMVHALRPPGDFCAIRLRGDITSLSARFAAGDSASSMSTMDARPLQRQRQLVEEAVEPELQQRQSDSAAPWVEFWQDDFDVDTAQESMHPQDREHSAGEDNNSTPFGSEEGKSSTDVALPSLPLSPAALGGSVPHASIEDTASSKWPSDQTDQELSVGLWAPSGEV